MTEQEQYGIEIKPYPGNAFFLAGSKNPGSWLLMSPKWQKVERLEPFQMLKFSIFVSVLY